MDPKLKKCPECGGRMKTLPTTTFDTVSVGKVTVEGEHEECAACGQIYYGCETARKFEKKRDGLIQKALWKELLDSGDFDSRYVSTAEAAGILKVSPRELRPVKSHAGRAWVGRAILRGSVYRISIKGREWWNVRSLELYRDTGDGRYKLN